MSDSNQPYVLLREEGTSVWFLGTLMTLKATGETTSHGFALRALPRGNGRASEGAHPSTTRST